MKKTEKQRKKKNIKFESGENKYRCNFEFNYKVAGNKG